MRRNNIRLLNIHVLGHFHTESCWDLRVLLDCMEILETEAKFLEMVQEGHWLWVYDNFNLHQVVRHEREGWLV